MPLHPHLHLLVPSSTASIALEARVYISRSAAAALSGLATTSTSSEPTPLEGLTDSQRATVAGLGIRKIVTAAHPWGRLGGNMLFPVIANYLPNAVFGTPRADGAAPDTAIATFNVRGVGQSGGSMPLPGFGIGNDGEDFAAVERAVADLVGGQAELYRLGYSYGTNLALNAPLPDRGVKRTILVSPAPTLFKAMTLLSGPTFATGLDAALDRAAASRESGKDARSLWVVFGDKDDFTGAATLRALGGDKKDEIVAVEISGCGHFYARVEDGDAAEKAIAAWISDS